jgi:hypothetical protein
LVAYLGGYQSRTTVPRHGCAGGWVAAAALNEGEVASGLEKHLKGRSGVAT